MGEASDECTAVVAQPTAARSPEGTTLESNCPSGGRGRRGEIASGSDPNCGPWPAVWSTRRYLVLL